MDTLNKMISISMTVFNNIENKDCAFKKSAAEILLFATLPLLCFVVFGNIARADCDGINKFATKNGSYIPGSDSERRVTGKGRLQFYSAPNEKCEIHGIFIIPGEKVDAYTEYDDFTWVVYMNMRTGVQVIGWVRSNRLKSTGLGMAPRQQ